jgi:hypothetical protein
MLEITRQCSTTHCHKASKNDVLSYMWPTHRWNLDIACRSDMCLYEVAVDSYFDDVVDELTDGMEL